MSETSAPTRTSASTLLVGSIVAGPLYIVVVAIQMLIRDGYDISRHAASLLSNGDLGWIQITNFVVVGLLTIAGAIGMRRALDGGRGSTWVRGERSEPGGRGSTWVRGERSEPGGRGSTWGPRLIGVYGVSLIGAGAFVADPAFGFPTGAPAGAPTTMTWHGALHFVVAGVGFLALIAACFVFARRFVARGERRWAAYSLTTGVLFLAAFAGIASGGQIAGINVAFAVAVVLAWTWLSAVSAHLRTR